MKNKNNKKLNLVKISFFLVLIILFSSNSLALKIAPASYEYNLETMNNNEQYLIKVLENDKNKDLDYFLKISDTRFLDFISLEKKSRNSDDFYVKIKKPGFELKEGNNMLDIVVAEKASGEGMFSSSINLVSRLNIFKPFKGAFLEGEYKIENNDFDDPIIFNILLKNIGTKKTIANGEINLFTKEDAAININEKIILKEITINIGEKGKIAKTWNHNLRRGSYESNATLYYEGKQKNFEKQVFIGKPTILFKNIELSNYDQKGISKINMELELDWNFDKEIFLELNNNENNPTETKLIKGYEQEGFEIYIENMNQEKIITIEAKDKEGDSLGKYEINTQDLIKKYEQKKFWKLMIFFIIILILLTIITIKIMQKKKKSK